MSGGFKFPHHSFATALFIPVESNCGARNANPLNIVWLGRDKSAGESPVGAGGHGPETNSGSFLVQT